VWKGAATHLFATESKIYILTSPEIGCEGDDVIIGLYRRRLDSRRSTLEIRVDSWTPPQNNTFCNRTEEGLDEDRVSPVQPPRRRHLGRKL